MILPILTHGRFNASIAVETVQVRVVQLCLQKMGLRNPYYSINPCLRLRLHKCTLSDAEFVLQSVSVFTKKVHR